MIAGGGINRTVDYDDMPHMLFLQFNLNLKADNIHWVCALCMCALYTVAFRFVSDGGGKRKNFFFFHFNWRCLGFYFCFCFENLRPHNSLYSALSLDYIMLCVCFCSCSLCARCALTFISEFSFYLRCFTVILSCVRVSPLRSCLHFTEYRCHLFLFVFDRDNTVVHSKNNSKKIRNGRHLVFFLSFVPIR